MSGRRTGKVDSPAISDDARSAGKLAAACAFDRAIEACGYTNDDVRKLLGVSESRVRKMRSRDVADLDVVPSAADVILADHELGERFVQELRAERLKIHGDAPAITIEQKAMEVLAADSLVGHSISSALRDGIIDGGERNVVENALRESEQKREQLAGLIRRRAR